MIACLVFLSALCFAALPAPVFPSPVNSYDYVLGTQTIGASYQFTGESKLVETARAIQAMGSNTIKFSLGADKAILPKPRSLTDIAHRDPSVRTVLDMPFVNYLLWVYPLNIPGNSWATEAYPAEYKDIYNFTRYLLQRYNHTGKTFYLGNWEGDWHLTHTNPDYQPTPEEVQNFIGWFNNRQKAIDDAKRDTTHRGVQVYFYMEVNRVVDAMQGKTRLTNAVLPHTPIDFVSYSAYDALGGDGTALRKALDYIAAHLPPKPGLHGKRVFIGEYGFAAIGHSPAQQDALARQVMRTALAWGCPFVLYWEMFNNEVTPDGQQRGFWLIDDKGVKQPIYYTHQGFYHKARRYVGDFFKAHGRVPTRAEFGAQAAGWLADSP